MIDGQFRTFRPGLAAFGGLVAGLFLGLSPGKSGAVPGLRAVAPIDSTLAVDSLVVRTVEAYAGRSAAGRVVLGRLEDLDCRGLAQVQQDVALLAFPRVTFWPWDRYGIDLPKTYDLGVLADQVSGHVWGFVLSPDDRCRWKDSAEPIATLDSLLAGMGYRLTAAPGAPSDSLLTIVNAAVHDLPLDCASCVIGRYGILATDQTPNSSLTRRMSESPEGGIRAWVVASYGCPGSGEAGQTPFLVYDDQLKLTQFATRVRPVGRMKP